MQEPDNISPQEELPMKKRTLPSGCQIFLGIFGFIILGLIGYFIYLNHWYNRVQAEVPGIQQKLMTINQEALAQFAPPPGVSEIGRKDWIEQYDVESAIEYKIVDPEVEIVNYYSALLDEAGWTRDAGNSTGSELVSYYKDSMCISIRVLFRESFVFARTDFLKQDFVPELPPLWYRKLRGEDSGIESCP